MSCIEQRSTLAWWRHNECWGCDKHERRETQGKMKSCISSLSWGWDSRVNDCWNMLVNVLHGIGEVDSEEQRETEEGEDTKRNDWVCDTHIHALTLSCQTSNTGAATLHAFLRRCDINTTRQNLKPQTAAWKQNPHCHRCRECGALTPPFSVDQPHLYNIEFISLLVVIIYTLHICQTSASLPVCKSFLVAE